MRDEKLKELESYINELKTNKLEEIDNSKTGFLSIKRYACSLNNGKTIVRERIVKNGKDGSAAIILPITTEGNVLLVVQPRVFKPSTVGVEVPAGYIEENEDPIESAKRELEEETGYVCEDMILLAKYFQDSGCSAAYNHCFLALNCKKTKEQHLDKDEFVRYFECSFDEALELIDMGYINGANPIIAFTKAQNYLKNK
jgi:ADP-ribose pyrophosphatase